MAKVTLVGDAIVLTSAATLDELKTVAKYRPKALSLMGGEDGKEEIFRVGVSNNAGNINQYGAEFGRAAHDGTNLACITMSYTGKGVNPVEDVAEEYGAAIMSLNKIEDTLPAVLSDIAAEKARIMENISIG